MNGARPPFQINNWSDIPHAISMLQQIAPHRVPLLQALYRGQIAYFEAQPQHSRGLFKRWCAMSKLPSITLIGDDGDVPTGPGGWAIARRVLQWSAFTILHGTGGPVWDYANAVTLAQNFRRVVLVECTSENLPVWQVAAGRWAMRTPGMILRPPPGGAHPVAEDRSRAH